MKRLPTRLIFVLVTLLILAAAGPVMAANSYWQRMAEGFPNEVVVYEHVREYHAPELTIIARIPQLAGTADTLWQTEFNQGLRDRLEAYVSDLKGLAAEAWALDAEYRTQPYEGVVDFEVKLNRGGLLSISIVNYAYTGGAHGMTYYDYLNVDLTNGQLIDFSQLFDTSEELERAAGIIDAQIAEQPHQFFIDGFLVADFHEDQGFYLQDTQAMICFGLYELAPYSSGIQEFAIPAP